MSDDLPSIAMLRRIVAGTPDLPDSVVTRELRNAAPLLLEIASAALVLYAPQVSSEKRTAAYDRMMDALAKVRP